MYYVLTAMLIAIGVFFGARWFVRQDASRVAGVVANLGKWLMIGVGALFLVRGNFLLGIPMIAMGIGGLLGFGRGASIFRPSAQRAHGQKSQVRSRVLDMELDHDTGEIDGTVLNGDYAGMRLSEISLEDLLALYGECLQQPDQSAALLQAYLDKTQPDWRESAGADAEAGADDHARSGEGGGAMTEAEAYEVLGLPSGANKDAVRKAHRALMKRFHPDRGGSSYLAAKINQAKDILLSS